MVTRTPTLAKASFLLSTILVDTLEILTLGEPTTQGFKVSRPILKTSEPLRGLVQSTVLANAVESAVETTFSIKVDAKTELKPGQAVRVVKSDREPELVGLILLVDKVSLNGSALIRKAVSSVAENIDQQGKGVIGG